MESRSDYIAVRGLRYHVRRWGDPAAPMVFLLHGWLDTSATWARVAAGLCSGRQVLSPDWRGFGLSEWPQDGYWFPDYVGDLEAVLDHFAPATAVDLVGHSMGGQVASLYAGARPARVGRLVLLDSLFLPDMEMPLAAKRYRVWLDELKNLPMQKTYASFAELAQRVRKQHPQLTDEVALFVAHGWGREEPDGRVSLCADPRHRMRGPGMYHVEESIALWREVTADTLFLDGGKSPFVKAISETERERRRNCFRNRTEDSIASAGHMVHFDAPDETAARIAAFLGRAGLPTPHTIA